MKNPSPRFLFTAAAILTWVIAPSLAAQSTDRVVIPLSHPGQPVYLEVELITGSITVEAHDNDSEIILEVDEEALAKVNKTPPPRADGLRRLSTTSSGFEIEEEDNEVEIEAASFGNRSRLDMRLLVPVNTSLQLETIHKGTISVRGVRGDHEIENVHGPIEAHDIAGSLVAETLHGAITVTFSAVDRDKAMGFATVHGTIDVTFPANLAADLVMHSEMGEILTGFDIDLSTHRSEPERDEDGGFHLSVNRETRGSVGGGGPELRFESLQGDIIIRKTGG